MNFIMHQYNNITMKDYRALIMLVSMVMLSATAPAQVAEDETAIANDLNTALTVQGINCDGIRALEKTSNEGYEVVCAEGGQYSISKTANGLLNVLDNVTGLVFKGIGKLYGAIPFTGQIYQMTGTVTEHNTEVARSLFSIIEVSGHVCEAITSVVTQATDKHTVSCANGSRYYVYTRTDGQVAVDVISTR